jgi:hypothetical protein|uniref:Uncharacterized protein n=1 Tax=Populus trichocarpa TaxID=3694 RepID=A0A2K2AQB1_POPTR
MEQAIDGTARHGTQGPDNGPSRRGSPTSWMGPMLVDPLGLAAPIGTVVRPTFRTQPHRCAHSGPGGLPHIFVSFLAAGRKSR